MSCYYLPKFYWNPRSAVDVRENIERDCNIDNVGAEHIDHEHGDREQLAEEHAHEVVRIRVGVGWGREEVKGD